MNSRHDQIPPDESEIEAMLSRFRPQPSSRLLNMMKSAPWKNIPVEMATLQEEARTERRIIWGLSVLIVIMLVGAIVFVPPIRAVASQIFHSFISAPTNQIQVQVTLTSPGDLYSYSDPSSFPLSVSEAQQLSGLAVKQISPIPTGFELLGARYDASYNTVTLLYQNPDNYLTMWLTQRLVGKGQDVFSIGQKAEVKLVKIGNIQGEFVHGGWQVSSTQLPFETQPPGSTVHITAAWDNNLPQSTLRWQVGGMAYELRVSGYEGPAQSDLINWANELK